MVDFLLAKFFSVFCKYLANGALQRKTEGILIIRNLTLYNVGSHKFSSKTSRYTEKMDFKIWRFLIGRFFARKVVFCFSQISRERCSLEKN